MILKSTEISRVLSITEATYAAERAKMMELNRQETAIRAQIQGLNLSRHDARGTTEEHLIANSEADFLWLNWVDNSLKSLNQSLSRILVEKSRLAITLAHCFGRNEVMQSLFVESKKIEIKKRERRDEENSS